MSGVALVNSIMFFGLMEPSKTMNIPEWEAYITWDRTPVERGPAVQTLVVTSKMWIELRKVLALAAPPQTIIFVLLLFVEQLRDMIGLGRRT